MTNCVHSINTCFGTLNKNNKKKGNFRKRSRCRIESKIEGNQLDRFSNIMVMEMIMDVMVVMGALLLQPPPTTFNQFG